jgi:hypothetical protein
MPLKGAKGAPAPVVGSPGENPVRRPHEAGAPLRCSLSPPTVFPLVKVRSPPSDSHWSAPPKRPSPCGCCTDDSVLCTRAVATRATLGCSRVARKPPSPDSCRRAVVPAGRRRRGDRDPPASAGRHPVGRPGLARGQAVPSPLTRCRTAQRGRDRDPASPRRPPGHRGASIDPKCPSTAQETGTPRTRVARRTQFRSKDPS